MFNYFKLNCFYIKCKFQLRWYRLLERFHLCYLSLFVMPNKDIDELYILRGKNNG